MDDPRTPSPESASLPLQGPHWPRSRPLDGDDTLPPLRLVLQPSGWSIELNKPEVVLGRHTSAHVRLPLPDVSRRHCRFVCSDGIWHVFDLNSLNGIFVNGEQSRHAILHHRDELRIGGFTFRIELPTSVHSYEAPTEGVLQRIVDILPEPTASEGQRKAS
jgi:pSer/pThr/pTyr-binding forkhead associated (FHA) protein